MNSTNPKYARYALVREMMQTPEVIRKFDPGCAKPFATALTNKKAIFLTGEGSSRIFPAKSAIEFNLQHGSRIPVMTEGATQAMEYRLTDFAVFGASNSGRTKEVIRLFEKLKKEGNAALFGLTANESTRLSEIASVTHVLQCGKEEAVAATKSVVEQALFYDALFRDLYDKCMCGKDLLAENVETALTQSIDKEIISMLTHADQIYFAGRNNGVAEELTLKTNEITRKKSDYLEGTYAVHGIEEVMDAKEVVIVINPFESEEEKFNECLVRGVGMKVVAIAPRKTSFPTVIIPQQDQFSPYIELAAGWNLLVEIGLSLGIDLDKPVRARKVGNEYQSDQ